MKFEGETDAVIVSETPWKRQRKASRPRRATLKPATPPPAAADLLLEALTKGEGRKRDLAAAKDLFANTQKLVKAARENPFGLLMTVLVEAAANKRKKK